MAAAHRGWPRWLSKAVVPEGVSPPLAEAGEWAAPSPDSFEDPSGGNDVRARSRLYDQGGLVHLRVRTNLCDARLEHLEGHVAEGHRYAGLGAHLTGQPNVL